MAPHRGQKARKLLDKAVAAVDAAGGHVAISVMLPASSASAQSRKAQSGWCNMQYCSSSLRGNEATLGSHALMKSIVKVSEKLCERAETCRLTVTELAHEDSLAATEALLHVGAPNMFVDCRTTAEKVFLSVSLASKRCSKLLVCLLCCPSLCSATMRQLLAGGRTSLVSAGAAPRCYIQPQKHDCSPAFCYHQGVYGQLRPCRGIRRLLHGSC